jgi:hypothetical protein
VGFHRLGIVLCVPFLLAAAILAFKEWIEPSAGYVVQVPVGLLAWVPPDAQSANDKAIAARLISDQNARGLEWPEAPAGT